MRRGPLGTGLVLALLLAVSAATAGLQIVWGPVLGAVTGTSAQVAWYCNVPAQGAVEIAGVSLSSGEARQAHRLAIAGLEPGQSYEYRLVVTAGDEQVATRPYTLRTPETGLTDFTFCTYSDSQDVGTHRAVVKALLKAKPRFVLHSGDLTDRGADLGEWKRFFPVIAAYAATVPLFPSLGNHEGNADNYYSLLPLSTAGGGDYGGEWYSVVYGSCQIISLDGNRRFAEQAAWLQALFSQPKPEGVRWRLAIFHQPPYTSGYHEPSEGARKYFCPYLQKHVDLVLNGHNHSYERSLVGGLNYVVDAGAAGSLYNATLANPYRQIRVKSYNWVQVQVTDQALTLTASTPKGETLDRCTILPRGEG